MTTAKAPARGDPRQRQHVWTVRVATTLALGFLLAAAAHVVAAGWAPPGGLRDWLAGAAFTIVGGRIAYRRPSNAVGWLLLAVGLTAAAAAFVGVYGGRQATLPWLASWLWWPAYGLLPLALLLFPEGRLPGPRWRWAALVAAIGVVVPSVGLALGTLVSSPDFLTGGGVDPAARPFLRLAAAGMVCAAVGAAAGVAALAMRWRRADPRGRRQLTWPLAAACAVLIGGVLESLNVPGMWVLGGAAVPVAAAVAIVRHGLYDLGTLFSRTISYAILTAVLAGLYVVIVVVLTRLVAPAVSGSVPEAVGALTIAVMFQPLRRYVQQHVDRRFNRARYDAARAIDSFASRVCRHVEMQALTTDLLTVLDQTVQPAQRSLWLLPAPSPREVTRGPGGPQARRVQAASAAGGGLAVAQDAHQGGPEHRDGRGSSSGTESEYVPETNLSRLNS